MGKEILVNIANRETRIAVLDDKLLVELRVEREDLVVGNIYKGRVENVLPGMDAAFLDIGLERNAFLYVADILPEHSEQETNDSSEQAVSDVVDTDLPSEGESDDPDVHTEPDHLNDSVEYTGASDENSIGGEDDGDGAGADEDEGEPAELETTVKQSTARVKTERKPQRRVQRGRGPRRQIPIQELVTHRQELMVQVVKGPRGTKGSRVSTRMSLPGRYLVLMPDANNLGISRKIDESKERDRLKRIVEKFRQPGYGIIVRTEAEGRQTADLYQDYQMLVETWELSLAKARTTPAPGLIYQDMSLIYTIIRDAFGSDVDKLILDSPDDYAKAHEIVNRISPHLADRIHLYDGEKPMFEAYKIEDDIDRLLRRKVWLKSGGYLVIDQTEALTSIDVNTGKFTGSTGLSETILQTNMESTNEIARQLRLRDIGGMIVLDFIDMDNARDKKSVTDALVRALKNDRSRTKISSISPLGLIEMTRKRTRETVDVTLTDTCPYCHGLGRIPSAETVSMNIERDIRKMAKTVNSEAVLVIAHPDVAAYFVGPQGEDIEKLERQVQRAIYVRSDINWHIEKYEVEPGTPARIEQVHPLPKRGQVIEAIVGKSMLSTPPWASAYFMNGYQLDITNGAKNVGQNARIRITNVGRSLAIGEVNSGAQKSGGGPNQGSNKPERSSGGRPNRAPAQVG
jgi:ribonuclease G